MKNNERINEIKGMMTAFSTVCCRRNEVLAQYLKLQEEILRLSLRDGYIDKGKQRIEDAYACLKERSEQLGSPATEELEQFRKDQKDISYEIRAFISGEIGENRAQHSLDSLRTKHRIMRNVELKDGDHRTELDFIVFTRKAVFHLEIKNPQRDIHIDSKGNYFRITDSECFDSNIGEKMNDKEYLLRKAIKGSGISNINIVSMVVFTNSRSNVCNEYEFLKVAFLSSLPRIIDNYNGYNIYSDDDIESMIDAVEDSACQGRYYSNLDIRRIKENFATLLAKLEEAENAALNEATDSHSVTDEVSNTEAESKAVVHKSNKAVPSTLTKRNPYSVAACVTLAAVGIGYIVEGLVRRYALRRS